MGPPSPLPLLLRGVLSTAEPTPLAAPVPSEASAPMTPCRSGYRQPLCALQQLRHAEKPGHQ